jgi:hypothetical protein
MMPDTTRVTSIAALPRVPALYCLLGGRGAELRPAYVGVTHSLRNRVTQHLLNRDSSIATGTSAVGLRPEYVGAVRWWEDPSFSDRNALLAAELVGFDVLEPALRSRGGIQQAATRLHDDADFRQRMEELILHGPSGLLIIPTLDDAMARIDNLEQRLRELERALQGP